MKLVAKTITITLDGHDAWLDQSLHDEVVPLLEHPLRRFGPGGPRGYQHEVEVIKHYRVDDDRIAFAAGLAPCVKQHLESLGHPVKLSGRTNGLTAEDVEPDVFKDRGQTAEDRQFLISLLAEPLKRQVHLRKASEIGPQIARFAESFPDLNIFVVGCNRRRARQLLVEISENADRPVSSDSRAIWQHHPRVYVGTLQIFHHASAEGFDIVIFTDVESALAARTANIPFVWQDGTWYAFLETPRGLTEYEQFQLEELCGPVVYAPSQDQPAAMVRIEFLSVQRDECPNTDSALNRKRKLYWHSSAWNEAVAGSATRRAEDGKRQTISILVESSEHGRDLIQRLPDWELITDNSFTSCIPAVSHQQVATFVYAERWGIGTDVVIRADGGGGWPLSAGFNRIADFENDGVKLIDFEDRVDGTAVKDTKSRRAAYQQMSWDVSMAIREKTASSNATEKERQTNRISQPETMPGEQGMKAAH